VPGEWGTAELWMHARQGGWRRILNWPYRFARDALKRVDKGLLGDLGHCLDALAVDCDVD